MRPLNALLALLVSLAIAAAVLEGGLRLLPGLGPSASINRFDPELGWSKRPGQVARRSTPEYDVTFAINALGLRDDPMLSPAKAPGTFRVLMLGDSFVQGYTVARDDLFVDQLERWWQAEGRRVDAVNAGTEGWSTDQEARWLELSGADFEPDLVLLFAYENDLFWNSQRSYLRFPKPRYHPEGRIEPRALEDPGPQPWTDGWAITRLVTLPFKKGAPRWEHASGRRFPGEFAAYFHEPPEIMREALARTRGALIALQRTCAALDAELCVVPIPNKASIHQRAARQLQKRIGVDPELWSADKPVETFLALCAELGVATLDPRPALRAAAETTGDDLYYRSDWHLNPAGNRALASFLHDALDARGAFGPLYAAARAVPPPVPAAQGGVPGWLKVYAALWLALGLMYTLTYRDEPAWLAPLKVAGLLALAFLIFFAVRGLVAVLPPPWGTALFALLAIVVVTFVLYKLGHRVGTIAELFGAFVRRGHWYLMPLIVVLLTIGSLLVVAASSPLVAPFIYTLF